MTSSRLRSEPHSYLPGEAVPTSYRVPIANTGIQARQLLDDLRAAADQVLLSGWFITGPQLAAFEDEFATYCGRQQGVGVGTGTDAISIALQALGIGAGDEVVTQPNTVYATAKGITLAGATPVFADIDPATGNLDPRAVEAAITPRTRAIVAVHLYGNPAPMEDLVAIGRRYGLAVVEDACQAAGASIDGKPCGSLGDIACFSFYPTKNLGAVGDGGMILTDDQAVAGRCRQIRAYGQVARDSFDGPGVNSRLDELQAAFLRVKLPHLAAWNERRGEIAARYRRELGPFVSLPHTAPGVCPNHHLFVVWSAQRDSLWQHLERHGVQAQVHYRTPLHLVPALQGLGYVPGQFPYAERHALTVLSLPMFPEMTDAQAGVVIETVAELFR